MYAGVVEMADRRIQRVPELPLLRTEIGDRVAFLDGSRLRYCAAGFQECLGKLSLTGMTGPNETFLAGQCLSCLPLKRQQS